MVKKRIASKRKKIAVITGTRAEYGLLQGLMTEIKRDPALELQVLVTAMHLSPEFGLTYKLIEQDGFTIDAKVEMLMSSDTAVGTAKSMGLGLIGFSDAFTKLAPDAIVLLGDRFESLAVAQAALVQKIPIIHIHGGELSEGAIDDAIRHSITKMSHLHFVAAEPYRKRVIQMGEHPTRVHNFGAPGLERIKRMNLLSRSAWEKATACKLGKLNFLVTYLPATLHSKDNERTLNALFAALDHFPDAKIIFTKANADEAGRFVNKKVDDYAARHPHRVSAFVTLGDLNYLSALQHVDVVIGNSSSGLIEVPHFRKPTVNIGNRQARRLRAASIIDCSGDAKAIHAAIKKALSVPFKKILAKTRSPYTLDKTSVKIKEMIKKTDFEQVLMKRFHDL